MTVTLAPAPPPQTPPQARMDLKLFLSFALLLDFTFNIRPFDKKYLYIIVQVTDENRF